MARGALGAIGAVAVLLCSQLTAQDRSPLSHQGTTLFAWLDRVAELPRLSASEFVRVTYTQTDQDPPQIRHELGFITANLGEQLEILSLDLRLNKRSWRKAGTVESVAVERRDLRRTAATAIGPVASGGVRHAAGVMLGPLELVVLARACGEAGWDQLAADLLTTAGRASSESLEVDLRQDLASHLAVRAFKLLERDGPREEVRRRLQKLVDEFPEFHDADVARSAIRALDETIARERRPTRTDARTQEDQIAALIAALVDQKGVWLMSPGRVYFFAPEPRDTPPGPVRDLWQLGYAAVPQLIGTLDDRRLTRAIYWRNARGFPIAVGEVAAQILEQIAGQRFVFDDSVEERVLKWWRTVKK